MRPLKLTLNGFKSFYKSATIDFEALSADGIYGISGKTGSGKSSIVEAVIFALYGSFGGASLETSDFINRRRDDAEVSLIFSLEEVTGETRKYEVYRKISADRANGAARPQKAELWEITEGKRSIAAGARDVTAQITALIGLDAKDFSYCVVLEQNKYDGFIKATNAERKRIVGRLFGLDRYGDKLAASIREKESDLKEKAAGIAAVIEAAGSLSEETIVAMRKQYNESQIKARNLKMLAENALEEVERDAEAARKYQRRTRLTEEAITLKKQLDEATALFSELNAEKEKLARYAEDYAQTTRTRLEEIAVTRARLEDAERVVAEQSELRAQKEELLRTIDRLRVQISSCESEETKLFVEIERAQQQTTTLKQSFRMLTGVADNETDFVSATEQKYRELSVLAETFADKSALLEKSQQKLTGSMRDKELNQQTLKQCEKDVDLARSEKNKAEQWRNEVNQRIAEESAHHEAAVLIAKLRIGEPCPICGNTIAHLTTPNAEDFSAMQKEAADAQSSVEETTLKLDEAVEAFRGAREDVLLSNRDYDYNVAQVTTLREQLKDFNPSCLTLCQKVGELSREAKEAFVNESRWTRQWEECKHDRALKEIEYKHLEETLRATDARYAAASVRLAELTKGISSIKKAVRALQEERLDLEKSLKDIEEKKAAAERASMEAAQNRAGLQSRLKNTEQELLMLPNIAFDPLKHAQSVERAEMLAVQDRAAAKEAAEDGARLECMEADFAKIERARKEQSQLLQVQNRLDRIKKMTGGGKLLEWLAQSYIEDFTYDAGVKLSELTNGEMELCYREDGFYIVDNFNNRASRKVATVSGGESFLVSLSLAVAIASKLEQRAGAKKIEFLFIDEGFGTLSMDKVDAVTDALCALSESGFVIGFISHVKEMQSRIPGQLEVTRDNAEEGSIVRMI